MHIFKHLGAALFGALLFFGAFGIQAASIADSRTAERRPNLAVASTNTVAPPTTRPILLSIASIGLKAPITQVGLTPEGAMAVPSRQGVVGWYADGTTPGQTGSAVIDAHVFEAFKNLKKIKLGQSVFVTNTDGSKLRFVVDEIKTYPYQAVPGEKLFNRADQPRLNLITCAGSWTADHTTFDHRLVVYTHLAA